MTEPLATIRASSWSRLFDCAYSWQRIHIDGVWAPSSGRARLGTAFHKGTAVYDQKMLDGAPISVDDAIGEALDELHDQTAEEVRWSDIALKEAAPVVVRLTQRYCEDIAPSREYVSVERKIEELDIETDHGVIRVTGTLDRERRTPAGNGVGDLKSGVRAIRSDGTAVVGHHFIQTGIYRLMGGGGKPLPGKSEVLGASTAKVPRMGFSEIEDDIAPLVGTPDQPGLLDMAGKMLKTGALPPNPRSILCDSKYCPAWDTCAFRNQK